MRHSLLATDGKTYTFINRCIAKGGMKDVFFNEDDNTAIGFYRMPRTEAVWNRLLTIVELYRPQIFSPTQAHYWQHIFCFPQALVMHEGKIGVVMPKYQTAYFFKEGSVQNDFLKLKGKEKEGKWFCSALHRNLHLAEIEKGNRRFLLQACKRVAQGVRKLHAIGLAHADLSYRNVLLDPTTGNATLIDLDGLVVPNKFPPEVLGTPDFLAPELYATNPPFPSIHTDQHSLSVLLYMYLLYRHPLRGGKIHQTNDPLKDEQALMGANALYIEHPTDFSNRPNLQNLHPATFPWTDVQKIPAATCGTALTNLFEQAFVIGLHSPLLRPTAEDWEYAIARSLDFMLPCNAPNCPEQWWVWEKGKPAICPYCKTKHFGFIPIIHFYQARKVNVWREEAHYVVGYSELQLYAWHVYPFVADDEHLLDSERMPLLQIFIIEGKLFIENKGLPQLTNLTTQTPIPLNSRAEWQENDRLQTDFEKGKLLVWRKEV